MPAACKRTVVADTKEDDKGRGERKPWAKRRQPKSAIGRSMVMLVCVASLCVL